MMRRALPAGCMALALLGGPLCAEEPTLDVQRALIERDQQLDTFSQRLRQSQQLLGTPEGPQRRALEAPQLDERRRLEEIDAQQLRDAGSDSLPRAYERARDAEARRALAEPYQPPQPEEPKPPLPLPMTPQGPERAK